MNKFVAGTLILTLSNSFAKLIDFFYKAHISKTLGSEGMGLYQLVFNFYYIVVMLSNSGIPIASSKIISEKIGRGKKNEIGRVSFLAICLNLVISIIWVLILRYNVDFICSKIILEKRVALGLICIAPSIILSSTSSSIKAYFYAIQKTANPAFAEVFEQIAKIFIVNFLIISRNCKNLSELCGLMFIGYSLGELASNLYLVFVYIKDLKFFRNNTLKKEKFVITLKNLLRTSLPFGAGSVSESAFHFLEDVTIISSFRKYGFSNSEAISKFGLIDGMAMPLIFLPTIFLSPLVITLMPEISRCNSAKSFARISYIITKSHKMIMKFSFYIMGILFSLSKLISEVIYKHSGIESVIKPMCFAIPFIYTNLISSAIINGLDGQTKLLKWNTLISSFRMILIYFLVPKFGIKSLLSIFVIDEIITCLSSVYQLSYFSYFSFNLKEFFIIPALFSILGVVSIRFLWKITAETPLLEFIFSFTIFTAIYLSQGLICRQKTKMN